jgi:nonribosomal peptide synthetase DhbF
VTSIQPERDSQAAGTLLDGFAAAVRAHPDRAAVRFDDRTLSYAELDAATNALASDIRERVPNPERPVGILMERSTDMVAAAIAVLKTGSSYVPVDPETPAARRRLILDAAAPALVVCSPTLVAEIPDDLRLVYPDSPQSMDVSAQDTGIGPGTCAYTIFTSGTTGRPKGVRISHGNVLHLFAATRSLVGFGTDDVWSMCHSFAFDVSVWEMWGALLHGGCLVVVPSVVVRDPAALRALLRDEWVTILSQTPTAFNQLVGVESEYTDRLAVRRVVFGGEALRFADLAPWIAKYGDRTPRLINMYGITETTVHASYRRVLRADVDQRASLIGVPLPGSDLLLVADDLTRVPPGEIGEIVVTGPGVGIGYLDDPELTERRFVHLAGADGNRVRGYRSGDLARRRADGDLEYVGRADDQVKIRGFRVELGDVESALAAHPAVRAGAVAVRDTPTSEKALVGYVVPSGDASPDELRLRADLSQVLPDYMVPSMFRFLPALPMTANGKLDRSALPTPYIDTATTGRAPRSLPEELLCQVFASALGRGSVGIDDDFFALGGHSLSAIRLINRIRAVLGVEVSIQDLFQTRTVAALTARALPATVRAPLGRRERGDSVPLSYAQQRLWFLHQIHGATPANHLPYALHLTGRVDVLALESAVRDVVARHEILRTVYPERDGTPVQRVLDSAVARPGLTVRQVDPARLDDEIDSVAQRGFDLGSDLPLRATLFTLDAEHSALVLVAHHIAVDGWSVEPLLRDLAAAYAARVAGTAPDWAPLPVQYADYALWQRELLGAPDDPGGIAAQQFAFWREYLRDAPDELDLPTDRPRPHVTDFLGDLVRMDLDADLHTRLADLARTSGTTVTMVLQAAVAGLLTRLGAGTDLPIGTAIAGRTDESVHALVGFFVNTVVTRTDTAGDPSFAELLRRVRIANLAAYDHQDLPFERLVEMLNPTRSPARHPLTQVMVGAQPGVPPDLAMPGLTVAARPVSNRTAKFDLAFRFEDRRDAAGRPAGVTGTFEYSIDLFDRTSATMIVERFLRLLRTVSAHPETRLSRIDVLGADERALLRAWNDTDAPLPDVPTVAALVERQVDRTPDAVALIQEGARWTYRELDEQANQIAHLLRDLGAGPERMVGLCLERGPQFVAAVLGTWKAGAAYVPLEPSHPADRRAYMLRDSGAGVVLSEGDLCADLTLPAGVDVVRLDRDDWVRSTARTRIAVAAPEHLLAYAVYTSGSTGRPKCVLIEHRGVLNRLRDVVDRFGLTPDDINLQVISLGFEVPVRELFGPLSIGASVVLLPPGGEQDPGIVVKTIRAARPTVILCAVHSLLESLLAYGVDAADFASVRLVGTGGEILRPAEAAEMMNSWGCEVINQYGPTETTMMACVHTVRPADLDGRIPVGRPLSNTRVHVLDSRLGPAPVGVTGEVYLAGTSVGRGYQGKPALSATHFVADPFGTPGDRMYRSGDLARWLPSGDLEFVGRSDGQVKVRGFRIELGEIETVLDGHPLVARAVVTVREDRPGDRRLAAYLLPAGPDEQPSPAALRDHLAGRLPDHMIPATFTILESLPLRLNGKLNHDLLPVPDSTSGTTARPARSPHEDMLCQLFAEVLGVPRVGLDDDFFQLGGHSLLAARLISRVRGTLGVELAMRSLFEAPTVAGLARQLGSDMSADALAVMLPLRQRGTRAPLFCIHPGGGLSWGYVGLLKHVRSDVPVYGIQAHGLLRPDEMPDTIEEMATSYVERIHAVQPDGPYRLLGWSLGGIVAYEMAVRFQSQRADVGLLAMLDCYPGLPDHFRVGDRTMLRSLLDPERPDVVPDKDSAELATALRIVREDTGALASLTESQVIALLRTMSHNRHIVRQYVPKHFDGDVLFFLATEGRVDGAPTASVWDEYVSGTVESHPIAATHITMLAPRPLAEIGLVVDNALGAR